VNRHIRFVAYGILVLFGVVFVNLNLIQVINAESLAGHEANLRTLLREYSIERGPILSADGETLARSEPTPEERLKFLRTYPAGPAFAHVTGFYSFIFGREALEDSYNDALTGRGGVLTMQDLGDSLLRGGRRGDTVIVSIDTRVQNAAIAALGSRKGAVVAVDPRTGELLAMASFPPYDPNPLSSHSSQQIREIHQALGADPNKPMLNRAINEAYPPGSTFKVVTATAALEHSKGIDTRFPSSGRYQPPQTDRTIGNFGGGSCGGDMADALRVSCNTYFARLGAEISADDFSETLRNFGLGERPPLDIRAAASRIPSEDEIDSPAFRALSAIGQFEIRMTPLQMALVAAAVANGGSMPTPSIMKEIRDVRGTVVRQPEDREWRRAMTEETASIMKGLMVNVVRSGTGRRAQIAGIEVGGKTGTAQAGQEGVAPHAWFIAFAGDANPRIAVAVIVENGGELGSEATGGVVAAPIAKAVIEAHRSVAGW